jgi:hypothetical protein
VKNDGKKSLIKIYFHYSLLTIHYTSWMHQEFIDEELTNNIFLPER